MKRVRIECSKCEEDCGGSFMVFVDDKYEYCILLKDWFSTFRTLRWLAEADVLTFEES